MKHMFNKKNGKSINLMKYTVCGVMALVLIGTSVFIACASRTPSVEEVPAESTVMTESAVEAGPTEPIEEAAPTAAPESTTPAATEAPAETQKPTEPKETEATAPAVTPTEPKATEAPKPTTAPKPTEPKPTTAPKPTETQKPTEPKPTTAPKPTEPKPTETQKPTEAQPTEPVETKPAGRVMAITEADIWAIQAEAIAYAKSKGFEIADPSEPLAWTAEGYVPKYQDTLDLYGFTKESQLDYIRRKFFGAVDNFVMLNETIDAGITEYYPLYWDAGDDWAFVGGRS